MRLVNTITGQAALRSTFIEEGPYDQVISINSHRQTEACIAAAYGRGNTI